MAPASISASVRRLLAIRMVISSLAHRRSSRGSLHGPKRPRGSSLTGQAGLAPEIKLHSRGRLGEAYERGTVCLKFYDAANLPDENVLLEDLKSLIRLLRILYDADDLGHSPENREPEVRAAKQLTEVLAAPLRSRGRNGQGFGLTAEERRVVERQAMDVAYAHLVSAGYVVEDVSKGRSYDFVATRDGGSIIVEVKGTTGGLGSVVLTTNEVTAHQSNHPDRHGARNFRFSIIGASRRAVEPGIKLS